MRYWELQPPVELSEHVECLWVLEGRGPLPEPQRVLPDGCIEMIVNLGDPFVEKRSEGFVRQPMQFVVGQMERPIEIAPIGRVNMIGVRLHAPGARRILGVPMSELSGRVEELSSVQRDLAEEVREACEADNPLEAIMAALGKRAVRSGAVDTAVAGALGVLHRRCGCVAMEDLADAAGLGRRQLERKFQEWVGASPKTMGRILRFQRVFQAIESGASNWADAAAECGYYDQSHLVRDFKRFAGECPTALRIPGESLTEVFLRKNRMTRFSKTAGAF